MIHTKSRVSCEFCVCFLLFHRFFFGMESPRTRFTCEIQICINRLIIDIFITNGSNTEPLAGEWHMISDGKFVYSLVAAETYGPDWVQIVFRKPVTNRIWLGTHDYRSLSGFPSANEANDRERNLFHREQQNALRARSIGLHRRYLSRAFNMQRTVLSSRPKKSLLDQKNNDYQFLGQAHGIA